jgi:hypothetical protein
VTTLAPSLVGRETELELLERMLDEAGGSSRFEVVTGELVREPQAPNPVQ